LYQRHFVLLWNEPESFVVMTTHKCGLVLVAAVVWMLVEVGVACWKFGVEEICLRRGTL